MNDRWKPEIPVNIMDRGSLAKSPFRLHRAHRENFKDNNQKYHAIAEIRQLAAQEIQAQVEKRKLVVQHDLEMRNVSALKGLETRNEELQIYDNASCAVENATLQQEIQDSHNREENNENESGDQANATSVKLDDDVSKICDDTVDNNHEETLCDDNDVYAIDHEQITQDVHISEWTPSYQPLAESTASDSTEGLFDSDADDLDSESLFAGDISMTLQSQDLNQVSVSSPCVEIELNDSLSLQENFSTSIPIELGLPAQKSANSHGLCAHEDNLSHEEVVSNEETFYRGASHSESNLSPSENDIEWNDFEVDNSSVEEKQSNESNNLASDIVVESDRLIFDDTEFNAEDHKTCGIKDIRVDFDDVNDCVELSVQSVNLNISEPENAMDSAESESFCSYHSSQSDNESNQSCVFSQSHANSSSEVYHGAQSQNPSAVDMIEENAHDKLAPPEVDIQIANDHIDMNWMKVFLRLIPSIIFLTFGMAGLHTRNTIFALQYQAITPRIERLSSDISHMHHYLNTLSTTLDKLNQSVSKHGAMDVHFESAYRAYYLSIESRRRTVGGFKELLNRLLAQTDESMQGVEHATIESVQFLTKHYQLPLVQSQTDLKSWKAMLHKDKEALYQISLRHKALERYLAEMPSIQFGYREWFTMWAQCPTNMLPFSLPQLPRITAESDTETHLLFGFIALFLALPFITCGYGYYRHLLKSYLNNKPHRLLKDNHEPEILSPAHYLRTRSDEDATTTA